MTDQPKCCSIRRRRMLQGAAFVPLLAGLAAGGGRGARAGWHKISKEDAHYIDRDHLASQICGGCHSFIDPTDCIIVEGPVSPWGWCNYFED